MQVQQYNDSYEVLCIENLYRYITTSALELERLTHEFIQMQDIVKTLASKICDAQQIYVDAWNKVFRERTNTIAQITSGIVESSIELITSYIDEPIEIDQHPTVFQAKEHLNTIINEHDNAIKKLDELEEILECEIKNYNWLSETLKFFI